MTLLRWFVLLTSADFFPEQFRWKVVYAISVNIIEQSPQNHL
jgi:hypothetical protein